MQTFGSIVLENFQQTTDNVELSTWSFEDAMAFVGAEDYAIAA
jgi:hypothetical protein